MSLQYFYSLEEALGALFGDGAAIAKTERISGGDINEAYGLTLTDGSHVFMKANSRAEASFFEAEAAGIEAIARTGTVGTPQVLGYGVNAGRMGKSFLLLEFVAAKKRMPDYWEMLGHQLADMHRADTAGCVQNGRFGFKSDNYIGMRRQINTPHESWITFFRDCRLLPQLQAASRFFDAADLRKITWLLDHLADFLTEPDCPSLLHGDLWAGNVMTGNDKRAWLIDPAVSVGHAEADIAMTELFGGFPAAFYGAYQEAGILQPDYRQRRDLYNLYHLLNHLNMFGSGYLPSVKRIVERYAPVSLFSQ